ncbi:MAG: hypothetical protein ABFC96_06185 [Thermoguttaceae bacterium]
MPQSLANVLVRIMFLTKERRAMLQNAHLRIETYRYLAGLRLAFAFHIQPSRQSCR